LERWISRNPLLIEGPVPAKPQYCSLNDLFLWYPVGKIRQEDHIWRELLQSFPVVHELPISSAWAF
jgi:hypothetical protein